MSVATGLGVNPTEVMDLLQKVFPIQHMAGWLGHEVVCTRSLIPTHVCNT